MSITDAKTIGSSDRGHEESADLTGTERRREILAADPYYPHTWQRALGLWIVTFFGFLGLAAFLTLVWPDREFEWFYVFTTATFATVCIGFQFLARKSRVSVLETAGKIANRE